MCEQLHIPAKTNTQKLKNLNIAFGCLISPLRALLGNQGTVLLPLGAEGTCAAPDLLSGDQVCFLKMLKFIL